MCIPQVHGKSADRFAVGKNQKQWRTRFYDAWPEITDMRKLQENAQLIP